MIMITLMTMIMIMTMMLMARNGVPGRFQVPPLRTVAWLGACRKIGRLAQEQMACLLVGVLLIRGLLLGDPY